MTASGTDSSKIHGVRGELVADGVELAPVGELRHWPGNARKHASETLKLSLREHGQYKPITIRDDGTVLAGNGTFAAMLALGWTHVAVSRITVDDTKARRIVLMDNRSHDQGGYDQSLLADELAALIGQDGGLHGSGFDVEDYTDLLAALDNLPGAGGGEPLNDPDEVPPLPIAPVTKPGDLWELGDHRVLCGDAFSARDREALLREDQVGCLLTDPPYGISLDTDYSKMPRAGTKAQMHRKPNKYRKIEGDDEAFDGSALRAFLAEVKEQFWFGADYYRSTLSPDDRDGSWLVWDKRKEDGAQDDVIGSSFELIWTAKSHQRRILRHYWCGAFGSPEARDRMHPTQKPVALLEDILARWAPEQGVVFDPFGGSGSTLIACQAAGRRARLTEIDALYVDVICRRFQEHTGIVPVLAATGQQHDFSQPAA